MIFAQINQTDLHFELLFCYHPIKLKKKGKLPYSLKLVMYETVYAQIKKSLAYICVFSYNVKGFNLV